MDVALPPASEYEARIAELEHQRRAQQSRWAEAVAETRAQLEAAQVQLLEGGSSAASAGEGEHLLEDDAHEEGVSEGEGGSSGDEEEGDDADASVWAQAGAWDGAEAASLLRQLDELEQQMQEGRDFQSQLKV